MKAARRKAEATEAPRTVPLKDITIAWQRQSHYIGEEGRQTVTIAGEELAAVLIELATERPSSDWYERGSVDDLRFRLHGFAEILVALSCVKLEQIPADTEAIFSTLGDVARDLAGRALGRVEAGEALTTATVTIGAPAETAVTP